MDGKAQQGILDVFHFDEDKRNFEDYAHENGGRCWYARDLAKFLGYETFSSFENAINRATQACLTLTIPVVDNFTQINRTIDGEECRDYKLSRFACYLVAMNGDVRKPQVAAAQAYFAAMAVTLRDQLQTTENVERLLIRDEISDRERSLSGTASRAGVVVYPFFQNEGYRGMYNMGLRQLKEFKRVDPKKCLLDFMGKEELAGNLFRLTQTEAKIKNDRVQGQYALEQTAFEVGRKVRQTMIELSGTRPENLPAVENIDTVKRGLKKAHKEFKKLDR